MISIFFPLYLYRLHIFLLIFLSIAREEKINEEKYPNIPLFLLAVDILVVNAII